MTQLEHVAWLNAPATQTLVAAFEQAGQPLRFVGGAVRDALLGRAVGDIDAATPAHPNDIMRILQQAGIRALPTGLAHGTVTALIDKQHIEITTLRKDVETDGRHATVDFTDSWREDALRRDFTMNALYCTPQGEVTDYFGGIEDAKAGRIIFIGEAQQRIEEDALRILRFFRFFAGYGTGEPDATALAACQAGRGQLDQLSGERIQQEMRKLLLSAEPLVAIQALQQAEIEPHVWAGTCQTDALAILQANPHPQAHDPWLRLAALLRCGEMPAKQVAFVLKRWRMSNKDAERLSALVEAELPDASLDEAAQKRWLRHHGASRFVSQVLLAWANQPDAASAWQAMLALADQWEIPTFPVTGKDIVGLGHGAGPDIGAILLELEAYWEDNHYAPDKNALLARVERGDL